MPPQLGSNRGVNSVTREKTHQRHEDPYQEYNSSELLDPDVLGVIWNVKSARNHECRANECRKQSYDDVVVVQTSFAVCMSDFDFEVMKETNSSRTPRMATPIRAASTTGGISWNKELGSLDNGGMMF
jgi:hypothetical protein